MANTDVICWARGDRCHGCPHYHGKAPTCSYRPPMMAGRFISWLQGDCSFRNIFVGRAEDKRIAAPSID